MTLPVIPGVSIRLIHELVSRRYKVPLEEMRSPKRCREFAWPRQMAMCLSREFTRRSWQAIGNQFGHRDHTTVIHAYRAVPLRALRDPDTADHLRFLRAMLNQIAPKPVVTIDDLYDVLGVARDASPDEIKAAHRKAVREHHPDVGGDPERFQAVQEAYVELRRMGKRP